MQYRTDKHGNQLSILGLGCMRLPRDKKEAERIILAAIDGGVNYFDTAYIYPNNEITVGEILAKHDKRKDIHIATKMPLFLCKSADDFERFFNEQLMRLQTDYIDYYFMHSISSFARWEALQKMGIEEWIAEKKRLGQIRQIGFSYHGTCNDFMKMIESYPWEFCMIQYNYIGENYQAGKKGLLAAAEKGIAVMVMEPLLGGKLATNLPDQAIKTFNRANAKLSPADFGLWWLWNQNEVTIVLSGINTTNIMESNLRSADSFRSLTAEELSVYPDVVSILKKTYKVNCTGCNYCIPCPQGINIPACLSAYNAGYTQGYLTGLTLYMTTIAVLSSAPGSPRKCNDCGKCEKICPQNIPVRKFLKKTAKRFELLPIRLAFKVIKKLLNR